MGKDSEKFLFPFTIKGNNIGYVDLTGLITKQEAKIILDKKITNLQKDLKILSKKLLNDKYKNAKPDLFKEDYDSYNEKLKEVNAIIVIFTKID